MKIGAKEAANHRRWMRLMETAVDMKPTFTLRIVEALQEPREDPPYFAAYLVRRWGTATYAGATGAGVGRRLRKHISDRSLLGRAIMRHPLFRRFWRVEVFVALSMEHALEMERVLIAGLEPSLNLNGVSTSSRWYRKSTLEDPEWRQVQGLHHRPSPMDLF